MATRRFSASIEKSGTKTFVPVPFDPNTAWGEKDRHYVTGVIDGHKIRGVLMSVGTQYLLPLGPAWLRDNDVRAAGKVDVELSAEGPLAETVAGDIAAALDAAPQAHAFFASLAPFYRKNYIRWIESAKREHTRAARIGEMVRMLDAGKTR
jgi:bacteriocin resistance YdeI/OmpD-like protein/uncharacterized protein DUF1905